MKCKLNVIDKEIINAFEDGRKVGKEEGIMEIQGVD